MAQRHSAVMVKMWQVAWHPQLKELVKSTGLEMKRTGTAAQLCYLAPRSIPTPEPPFPHQSNGDF